MPSIGETLGNGNSQMQAALDAGVVAISQQQQVVFTLYTKVSLAPDSSVFWIATTTTLTVTGSLHYATDRLQDEDQTIGANQVILTAEQPISEFNLVAPGTMWIGSWPIDAAPLSAGSEEGEDLGTESGQGLGLEQQPPALAVAFAQRGNLFAQAGLWHYSGFCVYPALSAQVLANTGDLPTGPIVSNSLPIWLAMNAMAPVYPSFLVPDNIVPPYIVAHIDPLGTQTLQAMPLLTWPGVVPSPGTIGTEGGLGLGTESGAALGIEAPLSAFHQLPSSQLMRDEVDLTLYGFTNQMAIQYLWSLIDASLNVASFGFGNSPAIQDAKRVQVELAALAQKKMIHVSANYYQGTANAIAYRLILQAYVESVMPVGGVGFAPL